MSIVIQLILALMPVVLQWLIDLLHESAAGLAATGDHAADAKTLLAVALADPDLRVGQRLIVRVLYWHAPDAIRAGAKLDNPVVEEITTLAALTG